MNYFNQVFTLQKRYGNFSFSLWWVTPDISELFPFPELTLSLLPIIGGATITQFPLSEDQHASAPSVFVLPSITLDKQGPFILIVAAKTQP